MSGQTKCNFKVLGDMEGKKELAIERLLDSFSICSSVRDDNDNIIDFTIDYVNDTACRFKDKDIRNYIGRSLLELFPKYKGNGVLHELTQVVDEDIPLTKKTFLYEEIEGTKKIKAAYDIRIVKLEDGFAATWRDITHQKMLEEVEKKNRIALANAEDELRRLAAIVESSEDAIIGNTIDGNITSWNKGAERIFGYSENEVIGKHITILAPPGKEMEMESILNRISQGIQISHFETLRKRKDSMLLEVSVTISPIFGYNGRIIGASTIARDITSRKQFEKTLIDSEERYRMLIEFLPYSVFVHQNGRIVFVNASGIKLLGADSISDILGKGLEHYVNESIIEQYKRLENNLNDIVACDTNILKKDGTSINIEAISTKLCFRNSLSTLTLIRDKTIELRVDDLQKQVDENVRKLYEVQESDKLKTEFFTNISHELKTPLNIILSSLQLYELLSQNNKSVENEKKIEKLTTVMKQNCYRLLRMINNLIDTTRIDTGFYKLYLQNCNIVSVVEDVVMSAADYVRNKGIDLQFDTEVEERIIACDPDKIERIVLNLLSNAVKFNKQNGSILVSIYMDNTFVCISVKDKGIGIEKDKLGTIFERFRQVDKSLTRKCEGSGIGLSLVKALTEMHGGSIEVKSEYGQGSEFIIRLMASKVESDSHNLDYTQRNIVGDDVGNSETEKINIEFSDIYFNK